MFREELKDRFRQSDGPGRRVTGTPEFHSTEAAGKRYRQPTGGARFDRSHADGVVGSITDQISTQSGHTLLDALFESPVTTVNRVQEIIGKSYPVANSLVADFERLGILRETTGQKRNRRYRYEDYVKIFGELAP